MHLKCISSGAQRLRFLETLVELLQFRQLRAVWRRRGAGFFFLLLWKEIHRRRRGFLSMHYECGNQQRAQKDLSTGAITMLEKAPSAERLPITTRRFVSILPTRSPFAVAEMRKLKIKDASGKADIVKARALDVSICR